MKKIKIVGALIFTLSIILALLSGYISQENKRNNNLVDTINMQKSLTQEISKTIFYIYKNKNTSDEKLKQHIKHFREYIDKKGLIKQNKNITKLWNSFYLSVQNFRNQIKVTSTYSNILLEKTVNEIYTKNQALILELNKILQSSKTALNNKIEIFKIIQYILFATLVISLIYLFTQVKSIIFFIQKFLTTSQKIINSSSIKELESIEISNNNSNIKKVSDNFNTIVKNINNSIEISTNSMQNSYRSLEQVERNIEDLLELVSEMEDENSFDKNLAKKEDALIQSLEEITISIQNLKNLKSDLNKLISHNRSK
jgi:methyl-accepting chemotaxis protein